MAMPLGPIAGLMPVEMCPSGVVWRADSSLMFLNHTHLHANRTSFLVTRASFFVG